MPRSSLLNVPYTGVPEVESQPRPQAWQNLKVNEDMFGAGKGKALQQLGSAIGTLGNAIGTQMDKNQAELDGIKAREIDTQVMQQYTQKTAAYTLLNGEQAVSGSDAHEKELLDIKENAIKNAGGNKSVERMVRSSVEGQYRRAWSTAFSHKTKQTLEYGDQVSEARIVAAQQDAAVTMDEDALKRSINTIAGETYEKKRRNNWSPEVTDLEIKNRTSTAYTGFIGNMAQYYPARAQEYYNTYKDRMNPAAQKTATDAITAGFAGRGAEEPGTQAVQGSAPAIAPRRPIPPMPPPPAAPIAPGRPGGQRSEVEELNKVQLASLSTGTMSDAPPPGAQRLAEQQVVESRGFKGGSNIPTNLNEVPAINAIPDDWTDIISYGPGHKYKTPLGALKDIPDDKEAFRLEGDAAKKMLQEGTEGVIVVKPIPKEKPKQEDLISEGEQPTRLAQAKTTTSDAAPFTANWKAPGYVATRAEVESYIIQQSRARGIDPGTALEVYHNEGLGAWKSLVPGENSYGPFQLYTGGGLGNKFTAAGHGDPSDPKKWRENIDFALNNVVTGGWGPWNGAKKVGITGKMGVANNARELPVGSTAQEEQPLKQRTIGGYIESKTIKPGSIPANLAPSAANFAGTLQQQFPDVKITSGHRDVAHNAKVGGARGSQHITGKALDLNMTSMSEAEQIKVVDAALASGAKGIGWYRNGVMHIDFRDSPAGWGPDTTSGSLGRTPAWFRERVAALTGGKFDSVRAPAGDGPATVGGNVRYASLGSSVTGTMTDASPELPSAATRYAQATRTDVVSPFDGKPVTADTTEANIRARMKWIEDDARANGHDPSHARAINTKMQAEWEGLKRAKVEQHTLAYKAVEDAVYGKDGAGKPKTREEIFSDPALTAQFGLLSNKEKEMFEKQIVDRNSVGDNRPPAPHDWDRLDALRARASTDPSVLDHINLSEWPKSMRPEIVKLRKDLYTNGVGGNAETKEINRVMEDKLVAHQLARIGVSEEGEPTIYGDIKSKMVAELRIWKETNDKPMTSEQAAAKMNMLLRTEIVPGKFWNSERRRFERPLTPAQEKQMVSDWNKRYPELPAKTSEDIPPSNRWYWIRKKEEAEKRRLQGGQ